MRLRQERFAHAYVDTNGNISEALRIAGYKPSNNNHTRLLEDPEIATLIRTLVDNKYTITKEEYEKRTLDLHEKEGSPTVKARYWELLGNVKGFTKDRQIDLTVNNVGEDVLSRIKSNRLTGVDLDNRAITGK